jgi:hypothetical protein
MLPANEARTSAARDKQHVMRVPSEQRLNPNLPGGACQGIKTPEELFQRWWSLKPGVERDGEFWTPKQVATHTRYSESRIRGLCDEGKLPYVKIGGRIYLYLPAILKASWSQTDQ